MIKEKITVEKIKKEISPQIEGFLNDEEYAPLFKDLAFSLGEDSEDILDIQLAMFTIKDNSIGFVATEVYDWFLEWQLFKRLEGKEPYASLLLQFPDRKADVISLSKRMLNGEEINDQDVKDLFKGVEDDD